MRQLSLFGYRINENSHDIFELLTDFLRYVNGKVYIHYEPSPGYLEIKRTQEIRHTQHPFQRIDTFTSIFMLIPGVFSYATV